MKPPLVFAATCVALIPAVIAVATVATCVWFERVWVPRMAGED